MALFKRKEVVPYAEFIKTLPPAPCGDQETHYHWQIVVGTDCELCAEQAAARREEQARAALAAEIAEKLKVALGIGVVPPEWQAAMRHAIAVLRSNDAGPQVRAATADGLEALLAGVKYGH